MANKKINQLVSKTSILSTDLFGIGDATTGQLFKKTIAELQAAIGGAVISVNGLVGTVVLDTDDIQELATPTNKYFTDARARGAISLTVTGNSGASTYSSGTGVLNVPTYTLAGLGGITATFLSGTSGISYNSTTGVISYSGTVYTDSSIRALLSGGTGISYNSSTGAISYSGTVYTDSSVRALISLTTTGTSGASTYNNTTGVINVPNYTLAGLGGISLTSLSGGTGITYNNTTGAISYSGTVYTDASVRALISASGAVSYNNTTGVISLSGGNLTEATSSVLTITGGTGAVIGSGTSIQVKQASSTVSGFLSSTDWSTFNGKANALSGTTNYIPKFTSSSTIGDSAITDNGTTVSLISRAMSVGGNLTVLGGIPITRGSDTFIGTTDNFALTFQTNSVGNRMVITSAGLIGIGTSSPLSALDVRGASAINGNYQTIQAFSTDSASINLGGGISLGGYYTGTSALAQFASIWGRKENSTSGNYDGYLSFGTNVQSVGVSERMRIVSTGQVLIGRSTLTGGTGSLEVEQNNIGGYTIVVNSSGSIESSIYFRSVGSANKSIINSNVAMIISVNSTESMRFHGTGNVSINTSTDNGYKLYVAGTIYATGNITANSDLTLKKNLELITNPTDKLMQLNGYSYQWKSDDSHQYGVIAQEVEKILPYAVSTGNDGIKGVSYNQIIPVLIEAVKEQKKELEELRDILASK